MLSGASNMATRGNERLGIPPYLMSDGPMGIHNYGLRLPLIPMGLCLLRHGVRITPGTPAWQSEGMRARAGSISSGPGHESLQGTHVRAEF